MNITPTPVDISNNQELLRLVEAMKRTNKPRVLTQNNESVALLMPVEPTAHKTIDTFDFQPLSEIKRSLTKAGYAKAEINDMIEALSELPQYADTNLNKSK